jgi:hypothetical protein
MTAHEKWRRELLIERIRDLNSARFTLPGNDYCNYGAPNEVTNELIKDAIYFIEADELDLRERACWHAERAQIDAIKRLRR